MTVIERLPFRFMGMKMGKRVLLAGGVGLGVLCASAAVWFTLCAWSNPGVMLENARRIQSGMTLEEVQAIFGEPGEEWGEGPGINFGVKENRVWKADGVAIKVWFGYGSRFAVGDPNESGAFLVFYDDGHSRERMEHMDGHSWEELELPLDEPPTQFERFRHWLRERLREDPPPRTDPVPFDPEAA